MSCLTCVTWQLPSTGACAPPAEAGWLTEQVLPGACPRRQGSQPRFTCKAQALTSACCGTVALNKSPNMNILGSVAREPSTIISVAVRVCGKGCTVSQVSQLQAVLVQSARSSRSWLEPYAAPVSSKLWHCQLEHSSFHLHVLALYRLQPSSAPTCGDEKGSAHIPAEKRSRRPRNDELPPHGTPRPAGKVSVQVVQSLALSG